jgi:glycosyltransferase involved in cell wall biosynthesis
MVMRSATIEIVVPVHNEAAVVEHSVRTLRAYLDHNFPFDATVTIADNASTDGTWDTAARVAAQVPGVRAIHLSEKGRGRALRAVWSTSTADVVAYMDVDLSTDLDAILPLVAPLISGHSDIAIGSRLARGAHVVRGPKREVISRLYNLAIRATTGNRFSDAQCGFKAARTDVVRDLLPLVEDNGWFFDTELLVRAEHRGLRIHEVPVDWTDDPDSRVDLMATSVADLRGLWRISRQSLGGRHGTGEVHPERTLSGRNSREETTSRFLAIGGVSTIAYLALFLVLDSAVGVLAANAIALTLCAIGNAAAHRSLLTPLAPPRAAHPLDTHALDAHPFDAQAALDAPAALALATRHPLDGHQGIADKPEADITALRRWAALRRAEVSQVGRAAVAAWTAGLALSTLALLAVRLASHSLVLAVVAVLAANAVISAGRFMALRTVMYHHHLDTLDRGRAVSFPLPQQ